MLHLVVLLLLAVLAPSLEAQRRQFEPLHLENYHDEQPTADYGAQASQAAINFQHIEEPALQQELEQYINRIRVEPHNNDLFVRETAGVLRNQAQRLALWQAEKGAKKAELKRLGKQFLAVWQLMHLLDSLRWKKHNVFMASTRVLLRFLAKKGRKFSNKHDHSGDNNKRPGK